MPDSRGRSLRALPVLGGLLPIQRSQAAVDVLAGITLAAVSIPVALGYAKIAGMPVVTGLYTLLLPMAAFAVLGSSRHLVVCADSATAAILGAALAGLAAAGSQQYVRLAGLAALLAGGLLLAARLARLGFLASFLSRTVLVGFLTGVGIQVAAGQLPDMLGVTVAAKSSTLARLLDIARALPQVHWADVVVSAGVIVIVLAARGAARWAGRRIPGLLVAVIAATGAKFRRWPSLFATTMSRNCRAACRATAPASTWPSPSPCSPGRHGTCRRAGRLHVHRRARAGRQPAPGARRAAGPARGPARRMHPRGWQNLDHRMSSEP